VSEQDLTDRLNASLKQTAEAIAFCKTLIAQRDALSSVIAQMQAARSNHPECTEHGDGDIVSCGWKRAVLDIDAAFSEATK